MGCFEGPQRDLKGSLRGRGGLGGIVRINVAVFEAREQCAPMSAETEAEPPKDTLEPTADMNAAERLLMVPGRLVSRTCLTGQTGLALHTGHQVPLESCPSYKAPSGVHTGIVCGALCV